MTFRNEVFSGVRHVHIDNFGSGTITIEPSPGPDVESALNAADPDFVTAVQIRQDHDQLRFSFPHAFVQGSAHLRLGVPAGLTFAIRSGSAEVSATADLGRTKIVSGSGDVTLGRAADLDCSTGSGAITVAQLLGRSARLVSGSGEISLGEVSCPLNAKSASGDVTVRELRRASMAGSSGSGDITVSATTGSIGLRSASGSLTVGVAEDLPAWLDVSSVSGEVRIALDSAAPPAKGEPFVAIRARTASGDVTVYRA